MSLVTDFLKTGLTIIEGKQTKESISKLLASFGNTMPIDSVGSGNYSFSKNSKNRLYNNLHPVGHSPTNVLGSNLDWHQDGSYIQGGYRGLALYPMINAEMVDTLFVNLVKVWNELDLNEKDEARNIELQFTDPLIAYKTSTEQSYLNNIQSINSSLVIKHPITNEECLNFSPLTMPDKFKLGSLYLKILEISLDHIETIKWDRPMLLLNDNYKWMHSTRPNKTKFNKNKSRVLLRAQFNYTKLQNV